MDEIICIIDQSGSMGPLVSDTVGSFNGFLREQKGVKGEANLTLVFFNHEYHPIFQCKDIHRVDEINGDAYRPNGTTALLDAVGRTVEDLGRVFDKRQDKPKKVIVVIITDGLENASSDYSRRQVSEMIEHQQKNYGWEFIFMGANIDAFAEAGKLNIKIENASNFQPDSAGVRAAYSVVSSSVTRYRTGSTS